MRELRGYDIVYTHCSAAVVARLNVVSDFAGTANVRSLLAPYACAACARTEERLLDARTHLEGRPLGSAPKFPCDCGAELELDDLAERYFSFLYD
jgi:hypothetical protein